MPQKKQRTGTSQLARCEDAKWWDLSVLLNLQGIILEYKKTNMLPSTSCKHCLLMAGSSQPSPGETEATSQFSLKDMKGTILCRRSCYSSVQVAAIWHNVAHVNKPESLSFSFSVTSKLTLWCNTTHQYVYIWLLCMQLFMLVLTQHPQHKILIMVKIRLKGNHGSSCPFITTVTCVFG